MNSRNRARAAFIESYGRGPVTLWQAPGRVNMIGEHTDYNDGFVLPCAIDRRTVVAVGPGSDGVRVAAADLGEGDRFAPTLPLAHGVPWADYVRGVARELLAAGHRIPPLDLAIAGDVPLGAGLSSSAALEVAVALALTGGAIDPVDAALTGQRAENNFVGCQCGIMDQLVSACAVAGHALLIDCRTLARRPVPLPAGVAIIVIDSGVRHAHAGGDYNQRRAECDRAAAHYGVPKLRDLDPAALAAGRAGLDDLAFRRARHVVTENARVLAFADAMSADDLAAMGTLMAASHASMRDDFAITIPAIDHIVALADEVLAGEGGSRMTGGGFGGSVVALAPKGRAAAVGEHIAARYRTPDGAPPTVTLFTAAPGAGPLASRALD
ncbi:galactokinase [Sphingomonas sp.]|uniref:galactokinase n=1 Tax=Sphingomonas sp. TaxID=28214 RepID=UPI003CC621E2